MDGTTEPVIAVIGHPIAGNPSQFALERAFKSMRLEWRVLSFDVLPEEMPAALQGTEALGFRGIVLDANVSESASEILGSETSQRVDSLYRDGEGKLTGYQAEHEWLAAQIEKHQESLGHDLRSVWVGDRVEFLSEQTGSIEQLDVLDDPSQVEQADLIFITRANDDEFALDVEDWPAGNGQTLVVDRSDGHADLHVLGERGYKVLTSEDCRIGMLMECLRRWTGDTPSSEVVRDAIEEYLAV